MSDALQIELKKIDIRWECICKVLDNKTKRYLQIFVLVAAPTFSVLMSMAIGKCPLYIGILIVAILLHITEYFSAKLIRVNKRYEESLNFILDKLDELYGNCRINNYI